MNITPEQIFSKNILIPNLSDDDSEKSTTVNDCVKYNMDELSLLNEQIMAEVIKDQAQDKTSKIEEISTAITLDIDKVTYEFDTFNFKINGEIKSYTDILYIEFKSALFSKTIQELKVYIKNLGLVTLLSTDNENNETFNKLLDLFEKNNRKIKINNFGIKSLPAIAHLLLFGFVYYNIASRNWQEHFDVITFLLIPFFVVWTITLPRLIPSKVTYNSLLKLNN